MGRKGALGDTPFQIMEISPFNCFFFDPSHPKTSWLVMKQPTSSLRLSGNWALAPVNTENMPVSGICLRFWVLRQLLTFPRNKHLPWNHFISVKIIEILPSQHSVCFFQPCICFHSPSQRSVKVPTIKSLTCVSTHMCSSPFLLSLSHPHHDNLQIKLLCFLVPV